MPPPPDYAVPSPAEGSAPDWAARCQLLMEEQASVRRELVAARQRIQQLTDEQASLRARLTALLSRLAPPPARE